MIRAVTKHYNYKFTSYSLRMKLVNLNQCGQKLFFYQILAFNSNLVFQEMHLELKRNKGLGATDR